MFILNHTMITQYSHDVYNERITSKLMKITFTNLLSRHRPSRGSHLPLSWNQKLQSIQTDFFSWTQTEDSLYWTTNYNKTNRQSATTYKPHTEFRPPPRIFMFYCWLSTAITIVSKESVKTQSPTTCTRLFLGPRTSLQKLTQHSRHFSEKSRLVSCPFTLIWGLLYTPYIKANYRQIIKILSE